MLIATYVLGGSLGLVEDSEFMMTAFATDIQRLGHGPLEGSRPLYSVITHDKQAGIPWGVHTASHTPALNPVRPARPASEFVARIIGIHAVKPCAYRRYGDSLLTS